MVPFLKMSRQYLAGALIASLALGLSGCQQLSQRYSVVRAPMVPSAPSPYSFPRGGAYSIADPMPDIAPRQPVLRPGHSIPLDPSPNSAPPPSQPLPPTSPPPAPLLNPTPVPPAPADPTSSRTSSGNSLSVRSKNFLNQLRGLRPSQGQQTAQRSTSVNTVADRSDQRGIEQVSPPAQLPDSTVPSLSNSRTSNRQPNLLPISAPDRSYNTFSEEARVANISGSQTDSDRKNSFESVKSPSSITKSNSGNSSAKQSTGSVVGDTVPAQTVPSSLPQLQSTPASVPVMLPPGA